MTDEPTAQETRPLEVWMNGRFVPVERAGISAFDMGFQHGVGLFETMRCAHGRIFRPEAHMARLAESARELMLTDSLRTGPLADAAQETVERNGLVDARVRLTLSGGPMNRRPDQAAETDPTILIHAQPRTVYPDALYEQGIRVIIANERLNPFDSHAGHKTLNYWSRLTALQEAGSKGAAEALWFTVSNHLGCGSTSNVFVVQDGALITPPARGEEASGALPAPVLPGITRAALLEVARENGLTVEQRLLDIGDVLGAQELMLSNSGWGLLPVIGVERESVGEGVPGPVFKMLRSGFEELLDRETRFGIGADMGE
ncbi:MAG: aminotransferase class IV [Phycisphaerales bacterium]|nr:aminotransferase class IV [Phycisphaerales bacterium]